MRQFCMSLSGVCIAMVLNYGNHVRAEILRTAQINSVRWDLGRAPIVLAKPLRVVVS